MNYYYIPKSEIDRIISLPCSEYQRIHLLAQISRLNTLYMIMRAGSGHIGSSFSAMDIVAWLYGNELQKKDTHPVFFSSKGHDAPGLYSILISLGLLPFEKIHELRKLGGLPGHPDVSTPHMVANTGSLGMGISKAKGMILANQFKQKPIHVYVLTGDGELQEGQIWESLVSAANRRMNNLTVIVDHNKIQSDTWVSSVSHLGDLCKKFESFGWKALRCNGHDFIALEKALAKAKDSEKPTVIIADTLKGKGVSFMEYSEENKDILYPYHSGALSQENYDKAFHELKENINQELKNLNQFSLVLESIIPTPKVELDNPVRLIPAYANALLEISKKHPEIIVLDADLMVDCGMKPFKDHFPERFIECGIAEQDMVSQASGLALEGMLPIVHSFACFLTPRANEQIYNNATEKKKIIYLGGLAGLVPGGPGHSHQSVRDISILSAIPGLELIEPAFEEEVEAALNYAVNKAEGSVYLRLVSIPYERAFETLKNYKLVRGKGSIVREGNDVVVFCYGPILLAEAFKAADYLYQKHQLELRIVNFPWLNVVDEEWLKNIISGVKAIVTLDNHYSKGGQGEWIASKLTHFQINKPIKMLGVTSIPACGRNDEVLAYHGLNGCAIADAVQSLLNKEVISESC